MFAAQFSLSHAGWLLAYPLAGWLGAAAGTQFTLIVLASLTLLSLLTALRLWPVDDPVELLHSHDGLAPDHPHTAQTGRRHRHRYVIDDLHRSWPE